MATWQLNNYWPSSQYATYPAPGQFINTGWSGWGGMSLGTFGGYIICQYDNPIQNSDNNSYGIDFVVNGNNFEGWSEPAGIMVAQDKNKDGKPDTDSQGNELWYALAGSEHYNDDTIWDYTVTYTNPDPDFSENRAQDVPWTDNYGGSGYALANGFHAQSYYPYPDFYNFKGNGTPVEAESITVSGVKLEDPKTLFGYAEASYSNGYGKTTVGSNPYADDGGCGKGCMDISWAVDQYGNPVYLDEVSFVKIYTAVLIDGGSVGELSPEISDCIRMDSEDEAVGETPKLNAINLSDGTNSLDVEMDAFFETSDGQYSGVINVGALQNFTVTAETEGNSYLFINNERAMNGSATTKTFSIEENGNPTLVRIIVQSGKKEPVIYMLHLINDTTNVDYETLSSLLVYTGYSPTDSTVLMKNEGDSYPTSVVFNPEQQIYTLATQTDVVTQLRFRALPVEEGATVMLYYGDGQSKDITCSGNGSAWANCLKVGHNVLTIIVTPPSNSDKQPVEYTVTVDCEPTLSDLSLSKDSVQFYLDTDFDENTTMYNITVPNSATTIDVNAIPKSDDYTITYNGSNSSTVNISSADTIDVVVTAGSGEHALSRMYTISLTKVAQLDFNVNATPSDAIVKVYDQTGVEILPNKDSSYSGMFSTYDYTYAVTKYGYVAQSGKVPSTGGTITATLQEAADDNLTDVGSYWSNFRGSDINMAITDVALPTENDNVSLKWNLKLGEGYGSAPSVQIIADNALILMSADGYLYKLDLETGEVLAKAQMAATPNWGYTPPTYAKGMIFCPLTDGTIQAFNAKTLESLWIYKDSIGGQSLSPITYSDGYIYTGFWEKETADANFVCISITDEDVTKTDETKIATWKHTQKGGFYWAGSVVVGDAVIVGTDDGAAGSISTAELYSFNKYTGAVICKFSITGDQRSSIAYDVDSGKIYFTTKAGYLYSAKINEKTGEISALEGVANDGASTSTPVVHDGKVYFGLGNGFASGEIVVSDANTLQELYSISLKGYPQGSVLLSTAYLESTGYLYLYTTYNYEPGGISMIKIDPDAKTADGATLIELYDAAGFSQYGIASLICSSNGTIYYKNDSSNILAVGVPIPTDVINLIDAIGTVTLDSDPAINSAITAYNALNTKQKALVSNYATLQSAIAKLSTLKIAECERLINAIGTVTLDKEDTIVKARTYYTSLSDDEQKKVDNYDKLTAAEEALKELKTDKPEPTGSTKSVTVTIKNIEYEVSEATANAIEVIEDLLIPKAGDTALPEDFRELTEEQVEDILSAYRSYAALTDDEKLFVENYEEFEAVLEKLGEEFHYDNESGVDVRGNEVLPWNVRINVQPQTVSEEQLTAIRETLGEEADMMLLCDIHFTDMLDGNEYEPGEPITVKIPIGDIDIEAYATLVIIHVTDDGNYEYIEGAIEGEYIVFVSDDFSQYAIAGSMHEWAEVVPLASASDSNHLWIWITFTLLALGALIILLFIKNKHKVS